MRHVCIRGGGEQQAGPDQQRHTEEGQSEGDDEKGVHAMSLQRTGLTAMLQVAEFMRSAFDDGDDRVQRDRLRSFRRNGLALDDMVFAHLLVAPTATANQLARGAE